MAHGVNVYPSDVPCLFRLERVSRDFLFLPSLPGFLFAVAFRDTVRLLLGTPLETSQRRSL